jgi:saccharopine dehydrogenase-like NADP-dependent oxidoreductase
MKLLDEINEKKGEIVEFRSFTGALPSPDSSNNPLGYKFSWSPVGVINASQSPASFLYEGEKINIKGNFIMAVPKDVDLYPGFNFRVIPNRDSMKYQQFYHLENHPLKTMMRGTIRYPGFCYTFLVFEALVREFRI